MAQKPFKFYIDGDPIAYAGAASAQKPVYVWIRKDSDGKEIERSEGFQKAAEAKQWIETECWEDDPAEDGWERTVEIVFKEEQDALDATVEVLKDYIKTCKHFCREGKEPQLIGWLTPSGHKDKDIEGLEDRYQFNRIGKEKPHFLPRVRQFLLEDYGHIFKMAKEGFEADTHVVGRAEKSGEDGCTLSIDKDIGQGEGTHHINMNDQFRDRECRFSEGIGSLWTLTTARGKDKTRGDGFVFLTYQAVVGDVSDGYKGLMGVGDKAAVKALHGCKTKVECLEAIKTLYEKKAAKGYLCKKLIQMNIENEGKDELIVHPEKGLFKYLSWNGEVEVRTVEELMEQHIRLAYQERSPNDIFNLSDYL